MPGFIAVVIAIGGALGEWGIPLSIKQRGLSASRTVGSEDEMGAPSRFFVDV